jgi:hypothetical protein
VHHGGEGGEDDRRFVRLYFADGVIDATAGAGGVVASRDPDGEGAAAAVLELDAAGGVGDAAFWAGGVVFFEAAEFE